MTDIERVYSDADVTRMILAGVDHPSLPSDYLTSEMARDRMREIERLRTALQAVIDFEAGQDFTQWARVIDNAKRSLEGKDAQEA